MEGDSLQIMGALANLSPNRSSIGQIMEGTRALLPSITKDLYSHIRRQANIVAHHLARFSLSIGNHCEWLSSPPTFILDLVEDCLTDSTSRRSYINYFFSVLAPIMFANRRQVLNHSRCSMRFASSEGYSVLNSSGLQHWFKNWQGLRKNKLTASTFAAAVGLFHRRRLQLWLEKIGALEPFSGNLATCWSNIKEEEALERYKLITGNSVLFPEFQVYGNRNVGEDWLGASPDGVIDRLVYGLPSRGVLEIKCPFFYGNMTKATPWSQIPLYCVPQAQGLMEILDRDWMDFYVWTPKGSSLFRVYRDAEYWDVLKIVLSDFWWNHVQPAREILSKSQIRDPLVELKSLKPAPRHELCSYIVYESKCVVDNSKLLMREINGKLVN
ncbi:hypothetical protein ACFX12_034020 [Malus domestica]